ncbi:MAG: lysylphosphatidylglycerol synthase domain-containing protein [Candidatus Hydrogenedentota bacterium]
MVNTRKHIFRVVHFTVSAVLLACVVMIVDLDKLLALTPKVSWSIWLFSLAFAFLSIACGAGQVDVVLKTLGVTQPYFRIFRILLATRFYALFVPGVVSSAAVKWYRLSNGGAAWFQTGITLGTASYLNLVVAAVGFVSLLSLHKFESTGLFLLIMFLCAGFSWLLFSSRVLRLVNATLMWIATASPRLHWIMDAGSSAILGFVEMPPSARTRLWVISVGHFLALGTALHFAVLSVEPTIAWRTSLLIQACLLLVQAIPISISGIGVREVTLVYLFGALTPFPSESALLVALLLYARHLCIGVAGGAVEARTALRSLFGTYAKAY